MATVKDGNLSDRSSGTQRDPAALRHPALYRLIWRWHFYAGLFCLPFVLWLSLTGMLYLFHPQIDAYLDRPYDHVAATAPRRPPSEQVAAALKRIPNGRLNAYQLPASPAAPAQILIGRGTVLYRVYVDPVEAKVLRAVNEDHRFSRLLFHLHGELLLGDMGSALVELAACWTIVMLLSGLYLWWPRGRRLAGVVYPRMGRNGRLMLRDLHAVTGFWVSSLALFLIVSGLPWAHVWGSMLEQLRQCVDHQPAAMDWSIGRSSELAQRQAMNAPPPHHGGSPLPAAESGAATSRFAAGRPRDAIAQYRPLDRLVPVIAKLALPPPVLIAPPSAAAPGWSARSDAEDRPRRVKLQLDPGTGAILRRHDFGQGPLLDRIIGYGVAAHLGLLFGLANQILGVFTALGLILLALSAALLWWRRRPKGVLGALPPHSTACYPWWSFVLLFLLGVSLPLLGLSMALIWLLERYGLRRFPAARHVLGLE